MKKYKRYVLCTLNIDEKTICLVFWGNLTFGMLSFQNSQRVVYYLRLYAWIGIIPFSLIHAFPRILRRWFDLICNTSYYLQTADDNIFTCVKRILVDFLNSITWNQNNQRWQKISTIKRPKKDFHAHKWSWQPRSCWQYYPGRTRIESFAQTFYITDWLFAHQLKSF